MIGKLPLVPFVIINLTCLTAGVSEIEVQGISLLATLGLVFTASRLSRSSIKTSGTRVVICRDGGDDDNDDENDEDYDNNDDDGDDCTLFTCSRPMATCTCGNAGNPIKRAIR